MKVILIKDVPKLGKKNEVKNVNDGHATNLLIPKGFVIPATPDALKRLELTKAKNDADRKIENELLDKTMKTLIDTTVTITGKVNDKGHLFAGLHREEIAKALLDQYRISIPDSALQVEHPIKEAGQHVIDVVVGDRKSKFKLIIKAA